MNESNSEIEKLERELKTLLRTLDLYREYNQLMDSIEKERKKAVPYIPQNPYPWWPNPHAGHSHWYVSDSSTGTLDDLAAAQGVKPSKDIKKLFGTWPGDKDDGFEIAINDARYVNRG